VFLFYNLSNYYHLC